ncbi:MAG: shikimate dehydrogenase [Lysinibacillus sp.]
MKKWFAVIGDPIAQSKSPEMHNAWFDALEIDATYIPLHVKEADLAQAVQSLKLLGASGWNVTIPHKQSIIPLLDELDEMAEKMGAVNTVVRKEDGTLKGYNTDGTGFVRSLEESIGENMRTEPLLVIGAGGAARGIVHALHAIGYTNITVANRTVAKAQAIIDEIGVGHAKSLTEVEVRLADYKIFVQTTPAGMTTGEIDLPFSMEQFPMQAIAADIVYNPLLTPFLRAAEEKQATIVNGLGMFVHQGAIAFEYWLNKYPNTNTMMTRLTEQLERK